MRNNLSLYSLMISIVFLILLRLCYLNPDKPEQTQILTWDAFGYYLYLPGLFIYEDITQMNWVEGIIGKYSTTGNLYQLTGTLSNGNRAVKYLMGISILNAPFFFAGHIAADLFGYPKDGFSFPYQAFIYLAALFYSFVGLLALRWSLLHFFSDKVTTLIMLLIVFATNYPQYVSIDSAMSHGYIFCIYACLIAATISWHIKPNGFVAAVIGALIGIGTISRPTEIIMVLIPILYGLHSAESGRLKWRLVKAHQLHIFYALLGGLLFCFPQLLYWKIVTGTWIYDVGSKWVFFNPNWKVLFGWEKGWFIYTPVAFLMVSGLFFIQKMSFYKSVLVFFLLNTWIVIAWFDWRYGASYSARALVQSYPVMALPLAGIVSKVLSSSLKNVLWLLVPFLAVLNVLQIWQYNKGILHFNDMNRRYYQAIFMDPFPAPAEMSLLDTKEYIRNEENFLRLKEIKIDSQFLININTNPAATLYETPVGEIITPVTGKEYWLKVSAEVLSAWGAFDTYLTTSLSYDGQVKETRCRMQNGISRNMEWNPVEYYFFIPPIKEGTLIIRARTTSGQDIYLRHFRFSVLQKKEN